MRIMLLVFLVVFSFDAIAENKSISGKIGLVRGVTTAHPDGDGRGGTLFKIRDATLDASCSWLWVRPEDKAILSLLLSAKAMQTSITAHYMTDVTLYNGIACEMRNFDI